jgi:hypothetical protein
MRLRDWPSKKAIQCAMARSANAIRLDDPKLKKLEGDALDQHAIERALVGIGAVVQTLGVSPAPELIFSGTRLFFDATRILVDAMEARAVKRLICVTGLGAGDSRGHGGLLYNAALWLILGRIYADKDVQEWIIRLSRLDWTIVRPTVLTNGRQIQSWTFPRHASLKSASQTHERSIQAPPLCGALLLVEWEWSELV